MNKEFAVSGKLFGKVESLKMWQWSHDSNCYKWIKEKKYKKHLIIWETMYTGQIGSGWQVPDTVYYVVHADNKWPLQTNLNLFLETKIHQAGWALNQICAREGNGKKQSCQQNKGRNHFTTLPAQLCNPKRVSWLPSWVRKLQQRRVSSALGGVEREQQAFFPQMIAMKALSLSRPWPKTTESSQTAATVSPRSAKV